MKLLKFGAAGKRTQQQRDIGSGAGQIPVHIGRTETEGGGYAKSSGTYNDRRGNHILSPAVSISFDSRGRGTWTNRDDVYNALNAVRFPEYWQTMNPIIKAIHDGHRAFWGTALTITTNSLNVIGWGLTTAGQIATLGGQPIGLGLMALGNTFNLMSTGINALRDVSNQNYTRAFVSMSTSAILYSASLPYSNKNFGKVFGSYNNSYNVAGAGAFALPVNILEFTSWTILNNTK